MVAARELDLGMNDGFETGDLSKYPWDTSGDAQWAVDCTEGRKSKCSARSGLIADSEHTTLEITREVRKGTLSFYVKTSTERKDRLTFRIDGKKKRRWSGTRKKWKKAKFSVSAGVHRFSWSYEKNKKKTRGEDAVWIDDVRFTPRR